MSKSSLKKARKQRQAEAQNRAKGNLMDTGIGIGISLAIVTLNEEFGFGRERGFRFAKALLTKINKEFKQDAKASTLEYEYNVEQGMYHLNKDLGTILGDKYLDELEAFGMVRADFK